MKIDRKKKKISAKFEDNLASEPSPMEDNLAREPRPLLEKASQHFTSQSRSTSSEKKLQEGTSK